MQWLHCTSSHAVSKFSMRRWRRFLVMTAAIIAVPVSLAYRNPSLSAKVFALTGATGVCIVCYFIPIVAHFQLLLASPAAGEPVDTSAEERAHDEAPDQVYADVEERLLADVDRAISRQHSLRPGKVVYAQAPSTLGGYISQVIVPMVVLCVGCGVSAIALYNSVK
jgi:solute carrier family 38 (sodium-coupled neutral amino acid transporter), member 11